MANCDTTGNLRTYAKDFLQVCETRNLNKSTLKAYRINLQQFCTFLEDQEAGITEESVLAYFSSLQDRFMSTTVNQKIASLSLFLSYLAELQVIPENPMKKLKIRQQKQETPFQTVQIEAIEAVLQAAYRRKTLFQDDSSYTYQTILRDIAVLELLFLTGIRVSELCQLALKDIDLNAQTISIDGIGYRQRVLPIESPETLRALADYQKEFRDQMVDANRYFVNRLGHGLSEQSVREMVKRYAEQAGIETTFTPKVLRDSVATLLAQDGADLVSLQHMLGHHSISRTEKYTKEADRVETKRLRDRLTLV